MLKRLAAPLLLAGGLAAAWSGWRRGRARPRAVLPAVDARAFAALSGDRPESAGELWARLQAMGASAAVLREESLAELAARGEVLYFGRAELAKWRAAGLIAPDSPLRGGTLLGRDPRALERAESALAARGVETDTATVAGRRALILPEGVELASVPAGFDPALISTLTAAGLIPAAASPTPSVEVAGRPFRRRVLPVDAPRAELLRAAYSRPLRLIVFRPRAELGFEENMDRLRESLRVLRSAGFSALPPAGPPPAPSSSRRWRLAMVWLLGALGPLLAVGAALDAARRARPLARRWSLPAPAPQVAAGAIAAWAASGLAGLAVLGAAPADWALGVHPGWAAWTLGAPVAAGVVALFGSRAPRSRSWDSAVRWKDVAALAAAALAAGLFLSPRSILRAPALWSALDALAVPWWWPLHWREALLGAPALAAGLYLMESAAPGQAGPRGGFRDPRGWLILGLTAPAALVAALGAGAEPAPQALAHAGAAFAFGLALSALAISWPWGGSRS